MTSVLQMIDVAHKHRRGDPPAVEGVTLGVAAGEVVALLGPNGAGKSTLLTVARTTRPTGGVVRWFGRDDWPRRELARRVAFLPQSPAALPGQAVADVLAAGRSPYWGPFGVESAADREAVAAVAEELDLTPLLGRPIDAISGGQRGRVFLGRCLAQVYGQPSAAVLLDEPDAALDLARAADLARLVRSLAADRGLAVVLASHDLNLAARVADRVVLLRDGRPFAVGPPAEVLTESAVAAVYGAAVRRLTVEGRAVLVPA